MECILLYDTLTPQIKGTPEPIYMHIALPTSLKNLVIVNGGSSYSFYVAIPSWRAYNFDVYSPFLIITCLVHLQTLMLYVS